MNTMNTINTPSVLRSGWVSSPPTNGDTAPVAITQSLREAILSGAYRGGQAIRQEALAKEFGVSRIPVREALQQLESEGLLTIDPHRGAFVSPVNSSEAEETTELRFLLEPHLLALAIPRMGNASLGLAEDILTEADGETDISKLGVLNWQFHRALYEASGRPYQLALLESVHLKTERYMRLVLNLMHHHERSQQEHRKILSACRVRNVERATSLLGGHIVQAGRILVHFLHQRPDSPSADVKKPVSTRTSKGKAKNNEHSY